MGERGPRKGIYHIGRPRKDNTYYTAKYGEKVTVRCSNCGREKQLYASQIMRQWINYSVYKDKFINKEDYKPKFFCTNECKGAWLGKHHNTKPFSIITPKKLEDTYFEEESSLSDSYFGEDAELV